MGGNRSQTTTSTSTSAPPEWQRSQIENLYNQGRQALAQMPTGPNATQLEAQGWLRGLAPGLSAGANDVRNLGVATARGDYLNPETNPFIRQAVEAAQRPLRQQLDQNVLAIGDAAQQAGAYGGSRQGIIESGALRDFNTAALDSAGQIYADNYARERALQQNAPALLSAANQLSLAPGQLLGLLGDQEQSWKADMPWTGIDRMAALLSLGGGYGTTTGTQTVPRGSAASGALSGAMGGASAGSAFGPWGAGIGAVLGGLGGAFG